MTGLMSPANAQETQAEVGAHEPEGEGPLLQNPEFWVGVAFVGFLLLMVYLKVPGLIAGMLDKRSAQIKAQLDEARSLRDQAEALLAEYRARQAEAKQDAARMLADAEEEAQRFLAASRAELDALASRRTQQAQDKIAQAETQAVKDVQNAAVDVAVAAAKKLIQEQLGGDKSAELVKASIADVRKTLH